MAADGQQQQRSDEPELWSIAGVADGLGFTESAVKKWRGAFLKAKRAGLPPGRNALPAADNEQLVERYGAAPRWTPERVIRWAELTRRRDPDTGEPRRPPSPGRPSDDERQQIN